MGVMCLLEFAPELCLDFRELDPCLFLLFSAAAFSFFFAFSAACCAINSLISAALSTTTYCGSHMDPDGERMFGVASGEQSSSSKTEG